MCARQVLRNFLITLLLIAFLNPASYLFAASRGIQVVSKEGQPLYLYKDYQAVVIGVSDYEHWPKLPNAVKDAARVAAKLKTMGFAIKLVTDPDSVQLRETLANLALTLGTERERAIVLYFAGHGETTKLIDGTDLGYIVPTDCPRQDIDPVGFDRKAVSMREIEMLALKVKSKHMLMLFDSCFSGSLFSLSRAAPASISEMSARPVRQFVASGDSDETVPDQSVFAECLIQGLDGYADFNRDKYITGSELGMYLQTNVINYSNGAQHPQYGKIRNPRLDKGDFIFLPEDSKVLAAISPSEDSREQLVYEYKRLSEQRERLEAEKQLLEKERQKLAYMSQTETSAKISLRKESKTLLDVHVKEMIKRYNFFDCNMNIDGDFKNDLVDNGDGTVTDRATGLMWQQGGSPYVKALERATFYVQELNKSKFAGYSDWRLPTIDELASLLQKDKAHGLHLNPLFDKRQTSCWSSDKSDPYLGYIPKLPRAWHVSFREGIIETTLLPPVYGRIEAVTERYVKAVRSTK